MIILQPTPDPRKLGVEGYTRAMARVNSRALVQKGKKQFTGKLQADIAVEHSLQNLGVDVTEEASARWFGR